MPSPRKHSFARTKVTPRHDHAAFWPLLIVMLLLWVIYRALFRFPVWFDEVIGKAVFFGLPVWLYINMGPGRQLLDSLELRKLGPGLLLGAAIGGLYGFAITLMLAAQPGAIVLSMPFFTLPLFWGNFWLAVVTSFWETLFFFVWVMTVMGEKYPHWAMWKQVGLVAGIFVLFHIPNALLQFSLMGAVELIILLAIFALGQALVFWQRRNAYALVFSQALWGMVLLVHLR